MTAYYPNGPRAGSGRDTRTLCGMRQGWCHIAFPSMYVRSVASHSTTVLQPGSGAWPPAWCSLAMFPKSSDAVDTSSGEGSQPMANDHEHDKTLVFVRGLFVACGDAQVLPDPLFNVPSTTLYVRNRPRSWTLGRQALSQSRWLGFRPCLGTSLVSKSLPQAMAYAIRHMQLRAPSLSGSPAPAVLFEVRPRQAQVQSCADRQPGLVPPHPQVRLWNRSHAQHARRAGEDAVAAGAPGKTRWRSGWTGAGTEVHDGVVQPVGIKGSSLPVRQPWLSVSVPGPPAQSTSADRLSTL